MKKWKYFNLTKFNIYFRYSEEKSQVDNIHNLAILRLSYLLILLPTASCVIYWPACSVHRHQKTYISVYCWCHQKQFSQRCGPGWTLWWSDWERKILVCPAVDSSGKNGLQFRTNEDVIYFEFIHVNVNNIIVQIFFFVNLIIWYS